MMHTIFITLWNPEKDAKKSHVVFTPDLLRWRLIHICRKCKFSPSSEPNSTHRKMLIKWARGLRGWSERGGEGGEERGGEGW